MAALTATDWTMSIEDEQIVGKKRRNRCKLTLATAGTYPSGGVPLPTQGSANGFGMRRNLDYIILTDTEPLGTLQVRRVFSYDQDNHALVARHLGTASITAQTLQELATDVVLGSTSEGGLVIYCEAVGW